MYGDAGLLSIWCVKAASVWPQGVRRFGFQGNGSLDSRPNFRGASTLLRGTSRTCGLDCEPQRAFRGQPPQAALRPRSRIRRDDPAGCLTGEGSLGACCFGFQTKTTPFASRAFSPKRAYARRSGRMRLTGEGAVPPPRMPLPGKLGSPARSGTV